MTLCVIVSAYCGSHASLTNVSQIFKYANVLLKRCSKIGEGDVMLLFQDTYGKWTKYDWMNWIRANSRKLILNNVTKHQNVCLQQLQKPPQQNHNHNTNTNTITMLNTLKECIFDCKRHNEKHSSVTFIYHIVLIGNENCLSFNGDAYVHKHKSLPQLQAILSLTRITPININMLCLCSPLANNKKYQEFELINNCCSVCNQQFFRAKPNKKQHFPKSCHQIALKQMKIQKCSNMNQCDKKPVATNHNQPPAKKRRLTDMSDDINEDKSDADDGNYDMNDLLISSSILFYQKLIDSSGGIFRWILTDFNQLNVDLVFQSVSNHIASHSKLRYMSMGCLMGKCMIFPGPNNSYFVSPNNLNNKIIKFESLNEKQITFEINRHIKQTPLKCTNSFIKAIHQNLKSCHCPLNILQENNVNISSGCDILSILGFLDRDNQWLPIPILSRHFIIPFVNYTGNKMQIDNESNQQPQNVNNGADICVFIKELLHKYNKIALVNLNPPNKPSWYGFIHSDLKSEGKYLLLDILSPYINVEELLFIQNQQKATPQYIVHNNNETNTMLNVYDSISSYFPTETNIIKEFDKFIRLLKQKKILECFDMAENIRKRALMFHIPHLITHLLSIINKELNNVTFDLPKENQVKHQVDVLLKLIHESQNDKRVKIIWNPPSNNNRKQRHKSRSQ